MDIKRNAQVIVIGAGAIGTSIAFHLAKSGCQDVIVLEKDLIGEGTSCRSGGGITQQFTREAQVRLSMESIEFFNRFKEETGEDCEFRQVGYMRVLSTEKELEAGRRNVALQQKVGARALLLAPEEVKEIVPALNVEDVVGATYCPTDGRLNDYAMTIGFANAARRLGVRIYQHTEVIGLEMSPGVKKVVAGNGTFESPNIVNAAGPYARGVARMIGLDIPVRAVKQHGFFTEPTDVLRRDSPHIIDATRHCGMAQVDRSVRFSMREPDRLETFDISVEWGVLASYAEAVTHRIPSLADVGIMNGVAGLKADTPDEVAILGEVHGMEGFYLACGLCGHGIMHAPAVGRLLADSILGRKCEEISAFSLQRFKGYAS